MGQFNRLFVKIPALILSSLQVLASATWGQAPAASATTPELYFWTDHSKQLFSLGEPVVTVLQLNGQSAQPILVSRLWGDEFVRFKLIGPDGNEVPWAGEAQTVSRKYVASDFIVLGQYKVIEAKKTISLKNGSGFAFDKPGQYSLTAEFSMDPPEEFARFAGQAKPPMGTFHSTKWSFCIEACILEPYQVSGNVPQAALRAVRRFYTDITKYQQLGVPNGSARKALWPLMSKRLQQELESIQACDDDYYRRYGAFLRANTYKPSSPWLEDGPFTGPNDAATPRKFSILASRSIGDSRVDVHLQFPEPKYCCSQRPPYFYTEGVVTVILENGRWVVDDYVSMYENDDLTRLSAGVTECKSGEWVGRGP
jgi:hypothetical protein